MKGKSKCHTMHIERKQETCPVLRVHNIIIEEVKDDTYPEDILSFRNLDIQFYVRVTFLHCHSQRPYLFVPGK